MTDLASNVVLGLFTYDRTDEGFKQGVNREIDIECAQWGDALSPNRLQYCVQPGWNGSDDYPVDYPERYRWFSTPLADQGLTTQVFRWTPDAVYFATFSGHRELTSEQIEGWDFPSYWNPEIWVYPAVEPVQPRSKTDDKLGASDAIVVPNCSDTTFLHLNLWWYKGTGMSEDWTGDLPQEVVISGYQFIPEPVYNVSGYILTQQNAGIPDVTVTLESSTIHSSNSLKNAAAITTATTDASGYYSFNVQAGIYNLQAQKDGYIFSMYKQFSGFLKLPSQLSVVSDIEMDEIVGETIPWQHVMYPAEAIRSIAIDDTDSIYYCGLPMIIGKCDVNGWPIWTKQCDSLLYDIKGAEMCLDDSNNMYITGTANLKCFLMKFNSSGNLMWAKVVDGSSDFLNLGCGVTYSADGSVYVSARSFMASKGYLSCLKFSTSGQLIWGRRKSVSDHDYDDSRGIEGWGKEGAGIAVDSLNDVYVTGGTWNELLLIKYSNNGEMLKQITLGAESCYLHGNAIAIDSNDNSYITGRYYNTIMEASCLAVWKFNNDCNMQWAQSWEQQSDLGMYGFDRSTSKGYSITIDNDNIYATGRCIAHIPPSYIHKDFEILLKLNTSGSILDNTLIDFFRGDEIEYELGDCGGYNWGLDCAIDSVQHIIIGGYGAYPAACYYSDFGTLFEFEVTESEALGTIVDVTDEFIDMDCSVTDSTCQIMLKNGGYYDGGRIVKY